MSKYQSKYLVHKRPSIKTVHTRSQKLTPFPLFAKCPHWLNPLVCADTTLISKNPMFLHQKVQTSASEEHRLFAKCPHWIISFPPDYECFLWTAPNVNYDSSYA